MEYSLLPTRERSSNRSEVSGARTVIWALTIITLVELVLGIYWMRGWFWRELTRYEPWWIAIMMIGEVAAVWWFVQFFISHGLRQRPFRIREFPPGYFQKVWLWFFVTCFFAMGGDLVGTLIAKEREEARFYAAKGGTAVVESIEIYKTGGNWRAYDLYCRYEANGRTYRALYGLKMRSDSEVFRGNVSYPIAEYVRAEEVGFEIPIVYDPDWPARSWLMNQELSDQDNKRSHGWCFIILIVQAFGAEMMIFAVMKGRRRNYLPWWTQLVRFYPLMAQAFVIFVAGLLNQFVFVPK
ncbi:MAG: hypothetical protein QGG25_19255 [Phycisphaerae bacterium]|nr:hypothetical protein [Phycisphaerae bacterium]